MSSRLKKSKGDIFSYSTSKKTGAQKFAAFSQDMQQDSAWRALEARQRALYIEYCLMQKSALGSVNAPGKDRPDVVQFQSNEAFYLNWGMVKGSGLYGASNRNSFYKDIKTLIEAGFLECLSNGKPQRTKSVYRLSSKWWKPRLDDSKHLRC